MPRDSVRHTFLVASSLCIICSVLVSAAAVGLRGKQERNKALDKQKNILLAAGLLPDSNASRETIDQLFERVTPIVIDLETGQELTAADVSHLEVEKLSDFDQRKAAADPALSTAIPSQLDLGRIQRRERYSYVYIINDESGNPVQIVLPVYGKGLWSTLYGFLALDYQNLREIRGLTFYEHGETPGLGGEVDNEAWKAQWKGKQAFNEQWDVQVDVVKGTVNPDSEISIHQVDGLSGATITSNGVEALLRYWLGEHGFGPYLQRIRQENQPGGGDHG